MGYYTSYKLEWKPLVATQEIVFPSCSHSKPQRSRFCPECGKPVNVVGLNDRVQQVLAKEKERNAGEYMHGIESDGSSADTCKWYDHVKEMAEFSKKFPDVLFILSGEGEESGDIWRKYFLDGKVQVSKVKIEFDEFDQDKLITPAEYAKG